jgi:hypothetical protein
LLAPAIASTVAIALTIASPGCGDGAQPAVPRDDASIGDALLDVRDASDGADALVHDTRRELPDVLPPPYLGPKLLSEAGLYSDLRAGIVAPGLVPFSVRHELWSDGAEKQRWLSLPAGTKIDTSAMDDWSFPVGTKFFKEFRIGGARIETRMLHKERAGTGPTSWLMISFHWRPDGSDADAVPDGVVDASGTTHDIPDREACSFCHEGVKDVGIGVSALQLSTADVPSMLQRFRDADLLSAPPPSDFVVPGTGDVQASLGYLHGNCGHCHNDFSFTGKIRALRLRLRVTDVVPEATPTYVSGIGAEMGHQWEGGPNVAIAPGDPSHSQILYRMSVRDTFQMPPACTEIVDTAGAARIRAWIAAMPP